MGDLGFDNFDEFGNRPDNLPARGSGHSLAGASHSNDQILDIDIVRRGNDKTTMSEYATPLFGLVVRLANIEHYNEVPALHQNTKAAIETFRRELHSEGYDQNNLNAASYAVCALIDETVMAKTWGAESLWPSQTMLSVFHNETWGGDQFFAILERVLNEAQRYPDLLDFMQMCLLLGFEGKYHIAPNGEKRLDELTARIDERLRDINPDRETRHIIAPEANVYTRRRQNVLSFFSPMGIALMAIAGMAILFAVLTFSIQSESNSAAAQLSEQLDFSPEQTAGVQ